MNANAVLLAGLVILLAGVIVRIAGDKTTGGVILLVGAAVLILSRIGGGIGRR